MKFGASAIEDALGGVAVHAVRREGLVLKKGDVVDAAALEALRRAGVAEIVVARLEADDIGEDDAALRLAQGIAGANLRIEAPFTGRCNLFSRVNGLLMIDAAAIDRVNAIDETLTVATLPSHRAVVAHEMVATVKVIPFAVAQATLTRALAAGGAGAVAVRAYRPLKIGMISTLLPGLKPSTIDKTMRVMEARLAPAGARLATALRCAHEAAPLSEAITQLARDHDLIVVFGASAITDRRDVIPSAILMSGGVIEHFGMPVDPGNLMLLGRLGGSSGSIVLGAPGCARSPKENGFDWVLQRILADAPVRREDIQRMGVGGLLMEIVSRGQPRSGDAPTSDE